MTAISAQSSRDRWDGSTHAQRRAFLERQIQRLYPGCTLTITITPPEAALPPGA